MECSSRNCPPYEIWPDNIPFTVPCQGTYKLCKPIKLKPNQPEQFAILIPSNINNVCIDLCCLTIEQKNDVENTDGIVIEGNNRNITIKNGTIKGFTRFGIRIGENVTFVKLVDLLVAENGRNGAFFSTTENLWHSGGIGFFGRKELPFIENLCTDIVIEKCRLNRNTTLQNGNINGTFIAGSGLLLIACKRITVRKTEFDANFGASLVAMAGCYGVRVDNLKLLDCSFNDIIENVVITANQGNNASALGLYLGVGAGISLGSFEENVNIKVKGCQANGLSGSSKRTIGFQFNRSKNIVIEDCQAENILGNSSDQFMPLPPDLTFLESAATGFQFIQCQNFTVRRSHSSGHFASTFRVVAGFAIRDCFNGLFEDCFCARLQNLGSTVTQSVGPGTSVGFYLEEIPNSIIRNTNIVLRNCTVENVNGISGPSTFAASGDGFIIYNAIAAQVINCISQNNTARGILLGINSSLTPVPLLSPSIRCIIQDNQVLQNGREGILDISTAIGINTNAYRNNQARNNNAGNYVIPPGNPIVTWNLSAGLPPPANDKISNIEII